MRSREDRVQLANRGGGETVGIVGRGTSVSGSERRRSLVVEGIDCCSGQVLVDGGLAGAGGGAGVALPMKV